MQRIKHIPVRETRTILPLLSTPSNHKTITTSWIELIRATRHGKSISACTDLASSQVDAHIASGKVKSAISSALAVLDEDLPPADLSAVSTVSPDGVATWPRDGFHPKNCP